MKLLCNRRDRNEGVRFHFFSDKLFVTSLKLWLGLRRAKWLFGFLSPILLLRVLLNFNSKELQRQNPINPARSIEDKRSSEIQLINRWQSITISLPPAYAHISEFWIPPLKTPDVQVATKRKSLVKISEGYTIICVGCMI